MDYQEIIKTNSSDEEIKKIIALFENNKPSFETNQEKAIKQYKVSSHAVMDPVSRPNKTIKKDLSENTTDGNTDSKNQSKTATQEVPVARIATPFQKLIVERRTGFMLSDPVTINAIYSSENNKNEESLLAMVESIHDDNKMDYKNKEIARRLMSEMEVAELWYLAESGKEKPKYTLKVKILSPDLGDGLYPLFDKTGSLIAFGRSYKLKNEKGESIEHFDVYTAEYEYKYINLNNTWKLDDDVKVMTNEGEKKINPVPNTTGKIMIIYYNQKNPEWSDVQSMIDRFETVISNHADMNDYFGSPILTVIGEILGYAQKGEQGKVLQLSADVERAQAEYLKLDSPPESIKMEIENLRDLVYAMSQTPDISFNQLLDIGGNISGMALKMMFLDAHMAVKCKEEIYGVGLQRRLNLLMAVIGKIIDTSLDQASKTLRLKPVITPYLPQNTTEIIDNLSVSRTAGIISTETAVEKNPLVTDSDTEMERIKQDSTNDITGIQDFNDQTPK